MTCIHDTHVVRHLGDHSEIMADEQDRCSDLGHQFLHQGQNLRLDRDVEGARRFIRDEERGSPAERDGNHDPLPHASGQFVGIQIENGIRVIYPHQFQVLKDRRTEILRVLR